MKYTPKQAPEGINTSTEHPLKELVLLLGSTLAIILGLIYFVIISTDYLVKYIPVSVENEIFNNKFTNFSAPSAIQELQKQEEYLNDLVESLQVAGEIESHKFKVHIIVNQAPNAFAYPGGNIGVTTGLLKLLDSENGLAMVLGHEIGHHLARDPIKGIGRGVIIGIFVYTVLGIGSDEWIQGLIGELTMASLMSFSRDQERAADQIGKNLIFQHYGHTRGASEFFEKINSTENKFIDSINYLNSHPSTEERILSLKNSMDDNKELKPLPDFLVLDSRS